MNKMIQVHNLGVENDQALENVLLQESEVMGQYEEDIPFEVYEQDEVIWNDVGKWKVSCLLNMETLKEKGIVLMDTMKDY